MIPIKRFWFKTFDGNNEEVIFLQDKVHRCRDLRPRDICRALKGD